IQYRDNGPALIDLLAGQVQVGFDTMPASIEYVRAGKLRALAVCTVTRSSALPDLPTVAEFVPGYESSGYFGFGAPPSTQGCVVLSHLSGAGHSPPPLPPPSAPASDCRRDGRSECGVLSPNLRSR